MLTAPRHRDMFAHRLSQRVTENSEISLHPPVVILCGGRGLRMHGEADVLPKPLVEIGGRPILWHVMSLYAAQGFRSFVLCLGHGGERIRQAIEALDVVTTVDEPTGSSAQRWEVVFADTGPATPTGGRVAEIADLVRGGTFCLTYADGLADVQLPSLLAYHRSHGRAATMTVVRPVSPWGVVELDGDGVVAGFREKPPLETWVNGGFFVMEPRSLGYLRYDDVLEERPLESLARDGELVAYRHTGFWQCMDTYKDSVRLNDLWERGEAPWAPPPEAAPGPLRPIRSRPRMAMINGPDPDNQSKQSFWRGRPVLVTGAQGFIGSWLVEALLDREAEVVVLVRDEPPRSRFAIEGMTARCTLVRADLGEMLQLLRVVNEHSVEAVFHLAAQTIVGTANRSPLSTFETNVRGTYNMLEACRLCGSVRRVVVASSDKAYGDHDELPYAESASLRPSYPYDTSKACADLIARSYATTYELPVAVTRLANVYGGGDFNFSRIVPDTVRSLLEDRRPVVRSDATPERDFMYVEDAVAAYLAIAEGLDRSGVAGQAFNAGSGRPVSVGAIVGELIEISGKALEPEIGASAPPAHEIQRQYVDSTLVRETFGWCPRYELENGLRMTYEWYERNLGRLPTLVPQARSRPARSSRAERPDGNAPPAPACSP